MKRVAIILPAYNEAAVIGSVLKSLPKQYKNTSISTVVVDDGSQDATATVAAKAGATVVRHLINVGSGGATNTGLEYARANNFDYAVTLDADGQHTATDCRQVLQELTKNQYDIVIGNRLMAKDGMPWHKILGNKGLDFVTFALFGLRVRDSQSGLKGFSRQALEKINIRSAGYEFCSEIIWRAKQQNLKVTEVAVKAIYTPYSMSKGQSSWNGFGIVKNLIKRKLLELMNA